MKKGYSPKTYQHETFTWYPDISVKRNRGNKFGATRRTGCEAKAGSQGEDWDTTYCYDVVVPDFGLARKTAYMACDYVL